MKFKLTSLISLITLVLGVSPLAVFAAFDDVTAGSGVNLGITVGGGQENFTLEGTFETFTVNAGNVSIGVNSGSGGSLVSTTSTTATTPTTVVAQATTPTPTPAQPATTPAATVAQPSPVAQLVSPVFNSDLQVGFRSDDVKRLQELLAQDKA